MKKEVIYDLQKFVCDLFIEAALRHKMPEGQPTLWVRKHVLTFHPKKERSVCCIPVTVDCIKHENAEQKQQNNIPFLLI